MSGDRHGSVTPIRSKVKQGAFEGGPPELPGGPHDAGEPRRDGAPAPPREMVAGGARAPRTGSGLQAGSSRQPAVVGTCCDSVRPMDEGALPDKLAKLPLFAELDDGALAAVATHVYEVEARAGQVLIEVGQAGSGMFVLEEGELEVQLPTGVTIALGPGEFVGDLALLTDEPHVARVRAHTDVRCLAISRQDFRALLSEQPRIAVAMLPVLARRLATVI